MHRPLSKHALSMYFAFVVRRGAAIALAMVIAHTGNAAGLGIYSLALVLMETLVRLAVFGTDVVVIRDMAAGGRSLAGQFGTLLAWRLAVLAVLWPTAVLGAPLLAADPAFPGMVAVMGAGACALSAADLYLAALQGHERVDLSGYILAGANAAGLLLAVGALAAGLGLPGVALAYALRSLLLFAGAAAAASRVEPRLFGRFELAALPALLREAAPIGVNRFLGMVHVGAGMAVLGHLHGEAVAGQFAGPMRLFEAGAAVGALTMTAAFPTLTRLHAESADGLRRTVTLLLRGLGWLALPACVLLALLGGRLLGLLFGAGFVPCGPALSVLMLAVPLSLLFVITERLAYAARDQRRVTRVRLLGLGTNLVLLLALAPRLGYLAPAVALLAAELVGVAALLPRWRRYVPGLSLPAPLAAPLALCAAAAVVAVLLPGDGGLLPGLVFAAVFALPAGAVSLFRLRAARPSTGRKGCRP